MESKTLYILEKKITTKKDKKKKEHPQRDFMKKICNVMFYAGGGNFWYEDRKLSKLQQTLYNIYAVAMNIYVFGNYFNEILANVCRDVLTDKEQNDLIQFTIGHSHVVTKILMSYALKQRIKILFKKMFEEDRDFAVLEIDLESVKIAKRYSLFLILTLTVCLISAGIDGVMVHFKQGKLH